MDRFKFPVPGPEPDGARVALAELFEGYLSWSSRSALLGRGAGFAAGYMVQPLVRPGISGVRDQGGGQKDTEFR